MQTPRLSTSMITLQGTSGSVLPIDFTEQWNQIPFLVEDPGARTVHSVVRDYPGGIRIKFEVESTGDRPSFLPNDAIMRLLCHVFVERLPSDAIEDVWGNIYDAWEWHRRPTLPAPRPETAPFVLGRIFEPVEEEPFTLTED